MSRKVITSLLIGTSVIGVLTGCANTDETAKDKVADISIVNDSKIDEDAFKMSKEEQDKYIEKLQAHLDEDSYTTYQLMKDFDNHVNGMNPSHVEQGIQILMDAGSSMSTYLDDTYTSISFYIENVLDKKGVDPTKPKTYQNEDNLLVKGFLDEINRDGLVLNYNNGSHEYDFNYALYYTKYQQYVGSDYREYLKLASDSQTDSYVMKNEKSIDLKKLYERLLTGYELVQKNKDADFVGNVQYLEELMYGDLFGISSSYIYETKTIDGKKVKVMTKHAQTSLNELLREYPKSAFAGDIREFLNDMDEHHYQQNDSVDGKIYEKLDKYFGEDDAVE